MQIVQQQMLLACRPEVVALKDGNVEPVMHRTVVLYLYRHENLGREDLEHV